MQNARGLSLHTKMAIGFAVGIAAGVLANFTAADADWLGGLIRYVTDPVGQVFLRLLFMLVVPLVFSALVLGVVEIGDPRSLGRIGGRTLLFILVVTTIAVSIGLVIVNLVQPGQGLPPELADELIAGSSERVADIAAKGGAVSGIDLLINIVPRNPIASAVNGDLIGVMFFALMFGIGATVVASAGTRSFVGAVQGVYDICLKLIGWIIQLAPYAVACLLFSITAKLGLAVLAQLAAYVGTVVLALAIHFFVVFPILVRVFGGMSPLKFFKGAQPAILTAFSTSSSSATLPTTLECAEQRLGVPRPVARFVCTLGATANMNGTALFEGITVLFLAQFFGVELSFVQQISILVLCIFGAIGAAGVPGGSLPVIAMILAMFGIPPEGIGLILGVDRFLDMCRTTVNVGGDLVGSVVVARGGLLPPHPEHGHADPAAHGEGRSEA
ncbi:dicarboxylate/amino acid:cation symporter [Aquimonas voraii]|uniref:Dicarboxylate/amino acid:cation (Na+ or H+) symporter, DAACS family n=1 Tax=Aquimonas voraii TaxID=265719 RepID=A0A1G6ZKP4_9GAMM|nr:dicarboxylate/amino acid:cation symporter [Aquimonas voraii]SDE02385.1 dicarboxylate/amino acid:cation (Na+ or H+) symporter, DAACS family [Aquimonas voraii]